ncbi:myelin regulatory factor-like protein isoform X2 [Dendroctonus ponderosae]|uniref:Myelin regulatory factor n=1 Tax=Dendroctonus ponderosae TaxID=77166 RepID=U4UB07_DENPD|nr:myelin regulatory factor-like protein isoform X2 [Dendroctonus ponderosae]ERL90242.1 hypothetical protein D910_07595 [Dendroctonus ponderosae]KAH1011437.1 hypothetical protein HUJ04_000808 [Dendroctonus ponderosae]KAH1018675.1 hypothetical protein HUJ05_006400 [Dendroctonus ponderosae]
MDGSTADWAAILSRDTEFVTGIEHDGIDFSIEDFINNDAFGDLTAHSSGGKVITETTRSNNNGHLLPESPPDSSSEYSPQDGCEPALNASETVYSNLGTSNYKPELLNPVDSLILPSQIIADQNNERLVDNNDILQDSQLLGSHDLRDCNNILSNRLLQDGLSGNHGILLADHEPENNRQLLISNASETGPIYNPSMYEQKEFMEDKHMVHLTFTPNIDNISRPNPESAMDIENIPNVYTTLQGPCKKRKLSQESPMVKREPDHTPISQLSPSEQFANPTEEEYASSEACLSEPQYQCIRFSPFQQANWHTLWGQDLTELSTPHYKVDADKGFNFSNADDAFVCQKKNHFQITCHVRLLGNAQFVKTPEGLQKISSFHLHFYGVKHDCPTQTIRVEQSQSDRSKKPFHPVLVELVNSQVTKVTVGRLHFSETTSNNMRKKGKPNPEQRYFQLVVGLHAHTTDGHFPVVSHASQKIIVRASNPGQFESDYSEMCWQKGQSQDSVFHNGKVGINTDKPDEALVVHGNIKITGHIIQPSDIRAKKNIVKLDSGEQLRNMSKINIYKYDVDPALQLSRGKETSDTGVIAQEVALVLPDAVRPSGALVLESGIIDDFLVVNKDRIFMESVGAVQELGKVTENLKARIVELERINRTLNRIKRGDSLKSDSTVNSAKYAKYASHCKCSKRHTCKYCERKDVELCSNKFIQVVIVILVLIMALCLAAITTLYLLGNVTPKRSNIDNSPISDKILSTKKPLVQLKSYKTGTQFSPTSNVNSYSRFHETSQVQQESNPKQQFSRIIGSPSECEDVNQALEYGLCPLYCCASTNIPSGDLSQPIYSEKQPRNLNKTGGQSADFNQQIAAIAKDRRNTISNDIDNLRSPRVKREAPDISNELFDDPLVSITIQGMNFSVVLDQDYLNQDYYIPYNFTYNVPISKYMPDEHIKILFRLNSLRDRFVQNCGNEVKYHPCSAISLINQNNEVHKLNRFDHTVHRGPNVTVLVDMADLQSNFVTYRIGSNSFQENLCNLTDNKLGVDFKVYHFHFKRDCDE